MFMPVTKEAKNAPAWGMYSLWTLRSDKKTYLLLGNIRWGQVMYDGNANESAVNVENG